MNPAESRSQWSFHLRLLLEAIQRGRRGVFAWATLAGVAAGGVAFGQAVLLSAVLSALLLPGSMPGWEWIGIGVPGGDPPWKVLAVLLFLAVLRALFTGVAESLGVRLALLVKQSFRQRLVHHLLGRSPLDLQQEQTGELVNTLSEGVESLDGYYSQFLPQVVLALILPLGFALIILRLDLLSGVILLVTGPLLPLFMYLVGQAGAELTRRQWQTLSRMSAFFYDVLQGLPTLKILGESQRQVENIARASNEFRKATLAVLRVTFLSALALELLSTLSVAIVAVQIGLRLLYGQMAFFPAFLILVLAPEYYLPLRLLSLRFHTGMAGAAAAEMIFGWLERPRPQPASSYLGTGSQDGRGERRPHPQPPLNDRYAIALSGRGERLEIQVPPEIRLSGITAAYPEGETILKNLTCTLPAGQLTVLAGPSGAGKSTLAAVLLGFLRPVEGKILVNGLLLTPGQSIPAGWLSQRPYLFSGTIAENIRMGKPSATQEEVEQAARLAGVEDFVLDFPAGYETIVGEHALRLSGGQAQRIALARAFLSNSPVLFLDEPTSHLDENTTRRVFAAIQKYGQQRTILVITHNRQLLELAQESQAQILYLNDGQVQPLKPGGLPGELLAEPEATWETVDLQDLGWNIAARASSEGEAGFSPGAEPRYSTSEALRFLLTLLRPNPRQVLASVSLGFAATVSAAGLMGTAAYLLARAALPASIADLAVPVVGVRFFGLSRAVFRYLERLATHNVTLRVLETLRLKIYQAIEPLAPAGLVGKVHSGTLLSRLTSDITALESFYVRAVSPPLAALLTLVTAGVFFSLFDLTIGISLVILMLISGMGLPLLAWRTSKRSGPLQMERRAALKVALVDLLKGFPDLVSLGRSGEFGNKVLQEANELDQDIAGTNQAFARWNAVHILCASLAGWLVLRFALAGNTGAVLPPLIVGALVLAAQASFEAFQPLALAGQQLARDQAAAGRMLDLVNRIPQVDEDAGERFLFPASEDAWPGLSLSVQDLTFSYPSENPGLTRPVLDRLTLALSPGKLVILTGPSGSGKSTLVNLFLRFWDYQQGYITLNGRDVRSLNVHDIRRCFAVLPQRVQLFNATLRDNLRLGNRQATDIDLLDALRLAALDQLVETLPGGLDTWVGEDGMKLSGGERQRLGLARAYLQAAPFLLLDEPFTALDLETALRISQGLLSRRRTQGILLITHHTQGELPDLFSQADEIITLIDGRPTYQRANA